MTPPLPTIVPPPTDNRDQPPRRPLSAGIPAVTLPARPLFTDANTIPLTAKVILLHQDLANDAHSRSRAICRIWSMIRER